MQYIESPASVVDKAIGSVWNHQAVEGCFRLRAPDPGILERVEVRMAAHSEFGKLFGTVTLPDGCRLPCGTVQIEISDNETWLSFFIPMGALSEAYPGVRGFPFGGNSPALADQLWRSIVDDWLA